MHLKFCKLFMWFLSSTSSKLIKHLSWYKVDTGRGGGVGKGESNNYQWDCSQLPGAKNCWDIIKLQTCTYRVVQHEIDLEREGN